MKGAEYFEAYLQVIHEPIDKAYHAIRPVPKYHLRNFFPQELEICDVVGEAAGHFGWVEATRHTRYPLALLLPPRGVCTQILGLRPVFLELRLHPSLIALAVPGALVIRPRLLDVDLLVEVAEVDVGAVVGLAEAEGVALNISYFFFLDILVLARRRIIALVMKELVLFVHVGLGFGSFVERGY